jgi:hypothetical protein
VAIHVNFSDSPQTRNVDLTSCAVANQPTIRYMTSWNGIAISTIAAGATMDFNAVFPAASAGIYICSNNAAAEYSPPTLSVRLADVASSSKIVVRYAYQPFLLTQTTSNTVDCSTGAACLIPVDRNIGPTYYQIIYLSSSGQVLATSDVQTM